MDMKALSDRQRQLLRDLAKSIADNQSSVGSAGLAALVAMVGRKYPESRELMVVGRASNGWGWRPWSSAQLKSPENIEEFVKDALDISTRGPSSGLSCPMLWITKGDNDGYNTKKS